MITYDNEYFDYFEIEHDFTTYYANGYVELKTTACIGSNYEGQDYETVYETEITDITLTALWYTDEQTGNAVDILSQYRYREIEEMAEEMIRYAYG